MGWNHFVAPEEVTPPVGLSTKIGLAAAAVAAIVAGVAAVIDGDHTEETITGIVTAAIVLYGVIRGRSEQAAALLAAAAAKQPPVPMNATKEPGADVPKNY